MKIKKTLFTTELEVTPKELWELKDSLPPMRNGLLAWIKEKFNLDMFPKPEKDAKTNKTT